MAESHARQSLLEAGLSTRARETARQRIIEEVRAQALSERDSLLEEARQVIRDEVSRDLITWRVSYREERMQRAKQKIEAALQVSLPSQSSADLECTPRKRIKTSGGPSRALRDATPTPTPTPTRSRAPSAASSQAPSTPLKRRAGLLEVDRASLDPANFCTDASIHKPEVEMADPEPLFERESTQLSYLTDPLLEAPLVHPFPAPPPDRPPPLPTPTAPDVMEVILNKLTLITDRKYNMS
ncbi:hypothetical protein B0F90DRAFT_1143515 [Multifurca ochricompacta]|uniref:Uncharacterized protein n=1 Tax=Multifurca ochricompacta TaxID=376703 RepID=A0AAD4M0J5_9AGAM|nr:hypothetical protein B0F90DRAFT_1143515 [Multifurca ochricompacta]